MFKKFSNLTLLFVLIGLVAFYFIIQFTSGSNRSEGYRELLTDLDTARIAKIHISGKEKSSHITRKEGSWEIKIAEDKDVPAMEGSVKSAISALYRLKPARLVSRSEDKRSEYQVDSTGTRVQIFEGEAKSLDLIIGRFNVQGRNSYSTYMRLTEEDEIYAVNNFMPFSVSADPSTYRNSVLFRTTKDSLNTISFNYPDSAFALKEQAGVWQINNSVADSAAVSEFLSGVSFVSSRNFFDETDQLEEPIMNLTFTTSSKKITVDIFGRDKEWIFHTSENPESYFKDEKLTQKLLKGSQYFL